MSNYFNQDDWRQLPEGLTPMPGIGGPCARCGRPTHIYEQDLADLPEGIVCGDCMRAQSRRQRSADGRREVTKQHRWKHGHDPEDDEDSRNPDIVYVDLQPTVAPKIDQRSLLHGGPETPFPCETCGTLLRAVAEKTVEEVLAPIGYKPPPGTRAPKEKIVALVCPNDKPDSRHKFIQIRESFLAEAMRRRNG